MGALSSVIPKLPEGFLGEQNDYFHHNGAQLFIHLAEQRK